MSRKTSLLLLGAVLIAFVVAGIAIIIVLSVSPSYFIITDQSANISTPIAAADLKPSGNMLPAEQPTLPPDNRGEAEAITPIEDAIPETQTADECSQAIEESQRLYNPNHGYCLLYPAEYTVEKPTAEETVLVIGGPLNHSDPRVSINVAPADGRSAEEIADQIMAEFGSGWEIERSSITLGEETAVRLDGLPGQDTYRRIIAVHAGQKFTLTFSPLNTDADAGLEKLYTYIVDTFTFVPPATGDELKMGQ